MYRIIHTHGPKAGRTTEVHGRAWGDGVRFGKLIPVDERLAKVAVGFTAHYDADTRILQFLIFAPMLNSWELIEQAAFLDPNQAMPRSVADERMRAGLPRIDEVPAVIVTQSKRVGNCTYIRQYGIGRTAPVY